MVITCLIYFRTLKQLIFDAVITCLIYFRTLKQFIFDAVTIVGNFSSPCHVVEISDVVGVGLENPEWNLKCTV
jgi:hypothetical protein